VGEDAFQELALWRLPQPVLGSSHCYKYRLAYVVNEVCVVRFDNEAGKGDHKHVGNTETPINFENPEQLLADFEAAITRWNHENRHS
jgi:hypothetical protein